MRAAMAHPAKTNLGDGATGRLKDCGDGVEFPADDDRIGGCNRSEGRRAERAGIHH